MSLEYIRDYYGVPAKKGKIVAYKDRLGVITGTSGLHIKVRLEGEKHSLPYHPSDLKYELEVTTYQGSKNIEVGQIGPLNVTIGCMSPEARDLLDTIMQHWGKHYAGLKESFPDREPDFYGFAYWLVRWSGLVEPASNQF